MRPTLFKIGNFELRIYSLMYILAFIIGIKIAEKDDVAKKRGIKDKKMNHLNFNNILYLISKDIKNIKMYLSRNRFSTTSQVE